MTRIHAHLPPDGQLICKTWCFAERPLKLRPLFAVLRLFGLSPVATLLSGAQLRQTFAGAGFDICEERVFGAYPQNPDIVARKRRTSPV